MLAILIFPCTSRCLSYLFYCTCTTYYCPFLLCYSCTHMLPLSFSIVLLLCLQHMHTTYPFPSTRTYAHVCSRTIDAHVRARTVRSRRRALAKLRLALVNARRHYQILFSTIVCIFFSIVFIPGMPAGYLSRILFDIISGYLA